MKKAELRALAIFQIDKFLEMLKDDKDLIFNKFDFEFYFDENSEF